MVRDGKLSHETILDYETSIKYPIDSHSWELEQTTKTLQYSIRDLAQGDYFGHEEILNETAQRQTRVRCITDCTILCINKDDFL